jgi:uncharacterized protein (DUF427 family)
MRQVIERLLAQGGAGRTLRPGSLVVWRVVLGIWRLPGGNQIMASQTIKIPGPDHPITIEANPSRVVVSIDGVVIADTREALTLREASYPPVQYIPRKDVDMSLLVRTGHATYCPYKGDCAYYSIPAGGERSVNAVWAYEAPYPAVAAIKDHLAFYPSRVEAIEERAT